MFRTRTKSVFLTFDDGILYDESTIDQTVKQILSLESPNTTFKVYREENGYLDDNAKLLRMYQYLGEYRVKDGNMLVYIEGDKITRVNGNYYSSLEFLQKGTELSETEIEAIAKKELSASLQLTLPSPANKIKIFDMQGKMVLQIAMWGNGKHKCFNVAKWCFHVGCEWCGKSKVCEKIAL